MPRNDRLAAVMIDVPMRKEKYTTTADTVPGKIWRAMIVQSDAPMLRAASMNVRCFNASVLPRTSRANVGTLNTATATMTFAMPPPKIATMPMANKMPGNANSTSQMRMIARSHQPS